MITIEFKREDREKCHYLLTLERGAVYGDAGEPAKDAQIIKVYVANAEISERQKRFIKRLIAGIEGDIVFRDRSGFVKGFMPEIPRLSDVGVVNKVKLFFKGIK